MRQHPRYEVRVWLSDGPYATPRYPPEIRTGVIRVKIDRHGNLILKRPRGLGDLLYTRRQWDSFLQFNDGMLR